MPGSCSADVAVIGGGIAGTSVAYHLARETDRSVALLERGELGGETTAKSAAFFGGYGSDLERRMKRYGMSVYNDLFRVSEADLRYEHVGRLRVATTSEGAESLRAYADGQSDVTALEPEEVHEVALVPDLDTDAIEAATYRPHVGYLRSQVLAPAFADRARTVSDEVRVETDTPVRDILMESESLVGVTVDGDRLMADHVVCAAGPWNPQLTSEAGIDLPVSHSLAPILRVDPNESGYTLPIVSHHETGVYARGDEEGVLLGRYPPDPELGRTLNPDEVPEQVPENLRETIFEEIERLLPGIVDAPVTEEWVGVRSHTPDGHPIAGETAVDGLSVAAFDSSGIQLSPAVGRTIARGIEGERDEFADALSPGRF